jgi:hypothetical protein
MSDLQPPPPLSQFLLTNASLSTLVLCQSSPELWLTHHLFSLLGIYPRLVSSPSCRNMCANAHSSVNCLIKGESTQTCPGILLSHKQEQVRTGGNLKEIMLSDKKPISELCHIISQMAPFMWQSWSARERASPGIGVEEGKFQRPCSAGAVWCHGEVMVAQGCVLRSQRVQLLGHEPAPWPARVPLLPYVA